MPSVDLGPEVRESLPACPQACEVLTHSHGKSKGFPGDSVVKKLPASAGDARDVGSIPGSGRSPGGGNGNPLEYSYLEKSMDRGAWKATVHMVTKSQT